MTYLNGQLSLIQVRFYTKAEKKTDILLRGSIIVTQKQSFLITEFCLC